MRVHWCALLLASLAGLAPAQERVKLAVSSDPPDASVFLHYPDRVPGGEDVFLGRTPDVGRLALELEPGRAEVVIAKPGYVCKVEPLDLPAGSARLEVRLTPDIDVPRQLVLKASTPFVKDAKEGEELYLAVLAQVVRLYVDEVDPRKLVDGSVNTLVEVLNAVRERERLLRRELPDWARERYYGDELDLRGYPPLVFERQAEPQGVSSIRAYQLSAGRVGIEGETDTTDLDSYLRMLRQISAFVRHRWDAEGRLSDSVITRCLIEGLLGALGDEHTQFLDPADVAMMTEETEGAFGGVGIEVGLREGRLTVLQPIPNTPASRAGLRPGDVIVAIDGRPTAGRSLGETVEWMRGEIDSPVEMTLERDGSEFDATLLRARVSVATVASRMLPGKVGYLRISSFMHEELDLEVRRALAGLMADGAQALVLDLRNNPGGLLAMAQRVADMFVPEGTIVSTRTRLPGESRHLEAEPRAPKFRLPLAVLINGYSASAAEILAGTLQEHELATLVGERSFGKGSVQRVLPLDPFGCALSLTVATYHLPSGVTPNKVGVTPDLVVTIDDEVATALATRSNYTVDGEPIDPQLAAALQRLAR